MKYTKEEMQQRADIFRCVEDEFPRALKDTSPSSKGWINYHNGIRNIPKDMIPIFQQAVMETILCHYDKKRCRCSCHKWNNPKWGNLVFSHCFTGICCERGVQ